MSSHPLSRYISLSLSLSLFSLSLFSLSLSVSISVLFLFSLIPPNLAHHSSLFVFLPTLLFKVTLILSLTHYSLLSISLYLSLPYFCVHRFLPFYRITTLFSVSSCFILSLSLSLFLSLSLSLSLFSLSLCLHLRFISVFVDPSQSCPSLLSLRISSNPFI